MNGENKECRDLMPATLVATIFNEEETIDRLLNAILSQSGLPAQIVIVDGGSSDSTFSSLKKAEHKFTAEGIKTIFVQKKCNISAGRNLAIHLSGYPVIATTDAGCSLSEVWFKSIVSPLIERDDLDVVSGNFEIVGHSGLQQSFAIAAFRNKRTNYPSSRSFAFRKSCWEAYQYPDNMLVHEDTKLCVEWERMGFRFFFVEDATVYWEAEKSIKSLFEKYARYAEWRMISGDSWGTYGKMVIGLYIAAFILSFLSLFYALSLVLAGCFIRCIRQLLRVRTRWHYLPIRFITVTYVIIALDLALLYGSFIGTISAVSRKYYSRSSAE